MELSVFIFLESDGFEKHRREQIIVIFFVILYDSSKVKLEYLFKINRLISLNSSNNSLDQFLFSIQHVPSSQFHPLITDQIINQNFTLKPIAISTMVKYINSKFNPNLKRVVHLHIDPKTLLSHDTLSIYFFPSIWSFFVYSSNITYKVNQQDKEREKM